MLLLKEEPRPSERALAALWQRAHALPDGLVTQDGRRFRVVYPGRPNARPGPDFQGAILASEDGETITGDVEVHLSAPDWYSHQHHTDPNYNGVILHVVLRKKVAAPARQQSGVSAPVAAMEDVAPLLETAGQQALAGLSRLVSLDDTALLALLERAGDQRFLARSRGFALELAAGDAEQVLYSALLEGLGYAANRKPFRDLARLVPLRALVPLREEPASTRLMAIRAMLLRASGLMAQVAPDEAAILGRLLTHLPRTGTLSAHDWELFRVRPANHPLRRIEGAAHLVDRYMGTGLVRGLEEAARAGGPPHLVEALTARPFIGTSRARDLAVNVALPFLHAMAAQGRAAGLSRLCLEVYRAFPATQDNEMTREMLRLLASRRAPLKLKYARQQQGLVQLYKGFLGRTAGQPDWGQS